MNKYIIDSIHVQYFLATFMSCIQSMCKGYILRLPHNCYQPLCRQTAWGNHIIRSGIALNGLNQHLKMSTEAAERTNGGNSFQSVGQHVVVSDGRYPILLGRYIASGEV